MPPACISNELTFAKHRMAIARRGMQKDGEAGMSCFGPGFEISMGLCRALEQVLRFQCASDEFVCISMCMEPHIRVRHNMRPP